MSGASPERWARAVAAAAETWGADRVIAEKNQGGSAGEYAGPGRSPDRADACLWAITALRRQNAEPRILGFDSRNFPIANREQIGNMTRVESLVMLVLDPSMMIALAALISSLSAFVWAVRRKP